MQRDKEHSLDIQDMLVDLAELRKSRRGYGQALKNTAHKAMQTLSVKDSGKLAVGAMAWQAAYNAQSIAYSQDKAKYIRCCFFSGLTDSAVSFVIDTLLAVYNYNSTKSVSTIARQLIINLFCYTLISGLWQPAVDMGSILGALISSAGAEVGGGIGVFILNASLFKLMHSIDAEAPSFLVAGAAETAFYMSGPLTLPGSPSGTRTVGYAFLFTLAGAISTTLFKKSVTVVVKSCSARRPDDISYYQQKPQKNKPILLWRSCCRSRDNHMTTPLLPAAPEKTNRFSYCCSLL